MSVARHVNRSSKINYVTVNGICKLPQGLRPLRADDVPACTRLFETYMSRFDLTPAFNAEEFLHWFTPRKGIVNSYVVDHQGMGVAFPQVR